MASSSAPKIYAFSSASAITKGKAVKSGSATDDNAVVVAAAKTDLSIGIIQNTSAAGGIAEVALPGGGGKALLGGTVAVGDKLAPTTDGTLIATTTAGDNYIAVAMQDGVVGDVIGVEIVSGLI